MSERAIFPDLVEIQAVTVDENLPHLERVIEYVRQIKNPYHYKCGNFNVTARFKKGGLPLEECLRLIMN